MKTPQVLVFAGIWLVASAALAYDVNKDLRNIGKEPAYDVAVVLAGKETVTGHYDGYANRRFGSFAHGPSGVNTLMHWQNLDEPSGNGAIDPNEVVHVGWSTADHSSHVLDMYWTDKTGQRIPGSKIFNITSGWTYESGTLTLTYDNIFEPESGELFPIEIVGLSIAAFPGAWPLAELNFMNPELNAALQPVGPQAFVLAPHEALQVPLPTEYAPGTAIVLRYRVTGPDDNAQATDWVQFTIPRVQVGACCYPDGTCDVRTREYCEVAKGKWLGPDTFCDACPTPVGACCFETKCVPGMVEKECFVKGGWYLGNGTTCELNPCKPVEPPTCLDPDLIHVERCYTPLPWQQRTATSSVPKLRNTPIDLDQNFVEDAIEERPLTARMEMIIDLNRCPSEAEVAYLATFGVVGYRSPYLSMIHLRGVSVADAYTLASLDFVAMVELNHAVAAGLDISTRAMQVRASPTYSPNTVEDAYGLTGTGVGIAIIDTGVDDGVHESLPAWKFVGGYNTFTNTEVNPDDDMGHGTHCAGIALGTGGPSGTYRGVAPGASLIDIKVLDSTGCGTVAGVIAGIDHCIARRVDWNIRVISMSLGWPIGVPICGQPGFGAPGNGTDALSEAVNNAVTEGIVCCIAAGNEGPGATTLRTPGTADDALTVAAASDAGTVSRADDTIANFSSRGPRVDDGDTVNDEQKPDVAGYGVNIMSAVHDTASSYVSWSGTSMATPGVAGLAALIIQFSPTMTALSVKQLIMDTAEDRGPAGWDAAWGVGLVNGFAAIDQIATNVPTDLRFDDPGCCWSTSLFATNPPVEGVPNTIHAQVTNGGPVPAVDYTVRVGVYGFSNGQAEYTVALVTRPGPLAVGATDDIVSAWTPQVSGTPPGVVHACLKADIIYPNDADFSNNFAQHNIDIQQSYSPANYQMEIMNPTDCDIHVKIGARIEPQEGPWVFKAEPGEFDLRPMDPPVHVHLSLTPRFEGAEPTQATVVAIGTGPTGKELNLGGVRIFAQSAKNVVDCNKNKVHDWIDIRNGTSVDLNGNGVPDECEAIPVPCPGDCDCDGQVTLRDIDYLVAAIPDNEPAWQALYTARHHGTAPTCAFSNCDINGDAHVDAADLDAFMTHMPENCP